MTVLSIAFNGTRLNDSDANTGWGNYVIGGGAPASEFPLAYQVTSGTTTGAVNKKINSSAARQGVDYNGTAVDYTAAANRLWYCKVYISDSFDLNATWGVEVAMGSADTSNFHQYNIAGSGANRSVYNQYPAQGGYLITCLDPTIDAWAEVADSGGTTDQTAITWYAVGAQFINGTAKTENVAMDAIDYGTGLTLTAGTGADPAGKYTDFVAADQNVKTARWGAALGSGDNVIFRGIATIGSATATEFDDSTSVVTFPDGYHSAGLFGVKVDIQNASTIVNDGALIISEGSITTEDTRADYIVTGTAGTYTSDHQLRNFRNITYTSACDVDGADIECQLLTQASANISNTTIKTNTLTSIACLQDPTFGTTTDLHDCDFVQTGVGHAIELSAVGATVTFTNLTFTGYGIDTANDAAIDVTAATGTTTITVSGGTEPTYKTAGATVVIIVDPVNVSISGTTEGTPITIIANETVGTITKGDVILSAFTDSDGLASTSFNYEAAFDPTGLDVISSARNQGVAVAAIADDGGVFTDETTAASSNGTNDMTLLPTTPVVGDAYYFGHSEQFNRLKVDVSTILTHTGAPTLVWEYWNGAWVALSGVADGTSGFETLGENVISYTLPGDWVATTVNTQGPLFYVRIRLSVLGTITQAPKGETCTLDVTRYLPYSALRTIVSGTGLADIATWTPDIISKFEQTD